MSNNKETSNFIFVVTAALFCLTAIAGFAPTSLELISKVSSGERAFPPFIVHFHAAMLSLWLLLLLTQASLAYTNRADLHKKIGLLSFILAPCVLISMIGVDFSNAARLLTNAQALDQIPAAKLRISTLLLIHSASYIFFPLFFIWAILLRKTNREAHKRLMVMATLVLMMPAFGRLIKDSHVLPSLGMNPIDARHFYIPFLIAPAILYELIKQRTIHWTYAIGLPLISVWMIIAHFIWGTEWWFEVAPKMLGAH